MKYTFKAGPLKTDFSEQVSKSLEKRTEIVSRKKYPEMWKKTDELNKNSADNPKKKKNSKFPCIICLTMGIFLTVPGIMRPEELMIPLIAGIIGIGMGIIGLMGQNKGNSFEKAAAKLISQTSQITPDRFEIEFSDDHMLMIDNETDKSVSYSDFECVIESDDLFTIIFQNSVLLLQKADLIDENCENFINFIKNKTTYEKV